MKRKIYILIFFMAVMNYSNAADITMSPMPQHPCQELMVYATIPDYRFPSIPGSKIDTTTLKLMFQMEHTGSAFIPVKMHLCSEKGDNVYSAAFPAQVIGGVHGVYWFIFYKTVNGLNIWEGGNPEHPAYLAPPATFHNIGNNVMSLHLNKKKLLYACEPLDVGDTLRAYFKNNCGDDQLAGKCVINDTNEIEMQIFGDSNIDDNYKDGFDENEKVEITVQKRGATYQYSFSYPKDKPIIYKSGENVWYDQIITTYNIAGIELSGNGIPITENSTTFSDIDGTNFGTTNNPINHTFTIKNNKCETLDFYSITISDKTNFSVSPMPATLQPGDSANITITYKAISTSTSKIIINTSASILPFSFTVNGEYSDTQTITNKIPSEKSINITTEPSTIIISNVSNKAINVTIAEISGKKIYRKNITEEQARFDVLSGIYIVSFEGKSFKILVQ